MATSNKPNSNQTKKKRLRPVKPEQLPSSKKKAGFFSNLVVNVLTLGGRLEMSSRQKSIVALLLAAVVVGTFYYGVIFGFDFTRGDDTTTPSSSVFLNDPGFQREIQQLEGVGDAINVESTVYTRIKFEELPVYPEGWVKRNFSSAEVRNALLSGPEADFDNDGLTNKAEFLYGSNPKEAYSLCDNNLDQTEEDCVNTDGENVAAGISPLTGFELEESREIILERQDSTLVGSIEDSFATAAEEGVDFPSLYQLSRLIDLTDEAQEFNVNIVNDTRETYVNYLQLRVESVRKVLRTDEVETQLASLIQIYNFSQVEDLEAEREVYDEIVRALENAAVPSAYETSHRALVMAFTKVQELIDHRIEGIQTNTLGDSDYQARSKELATEIVWGYRVYAEEIDNRELI
jgi:hypothetical protein